MTGESCRKEPRNLPLTFPDADDNVSRMSTNPARIIRTSDRKLKLAIEAELPKIQRQRADQESDEIDELVNMLDRAGHPVVSMEMPGGDPEEASRLATKVRNRAATRNLIITQRVRPDLNKVFFAVVDE